MNKAPWTQEFVDHLNENQRGFSRVELSDGTFMNVHTHPYTCCSTTSSGETCNRNEHNDGILIATTDGWVCPCGKYTQDWAH